MSAAIGPGMRVKCIDGSGFLNGPTTDSIWTVEEIQRAGSKYSVGWLHGELGMDYLRLIGWPKRMFRADFFVPLDGNEDLSVLTGLLDKIRTREKVS